MPRSFLKTWLGLSRTRLFVAVVVPGVIGGTVAESQGSFSVGPFLLVIAGLVLAESFNLLFGDWAAGEGKGLLPGVAPPPVIEGSPMIAERVLPSKYALHASALCLLSASLVLIYFLLVRGWPILVLGLLAVLIGFFYTLSPMEYGFFSTAFLPPLLTLSVDFALGGKFTQVAFLAGLPLLFSSSGVIYTYRILYSRQTGIDNFSRGSRVLLLLYCLAFISIILLSAFGLLPTTTLFGVLALPILVYLNIRLRKERLDYIPATSLGVLLHASMGLLIAFGFVLG